MTREEAEAAIRAWPEEEEAMLAEIEAQREADRRRAVLQEAADWLRHEGEAFLADKLIKELTP